MRSLSEYREMLEDLEGGTIPVGLGLEIVAVAEAERDKLAGEYTIAQAVEKSGKSRSYFERRVVDWQSHSLARRLGRQWMVRASVVPVREVRGGFDPSITAEDLAAALDQLDQVA